MINRCPLDSAGRPPARRDLTIAAGVLNYYEQAHDDKNILSSAAVIRPERVSVIVFDGKYTWKGNSTQKKRPISWWRSAYRLRIVDISNDEPGVLFLKPFIVFFADTGEGASVANCLPDLAKKICEDFGLDLNRAAWIEDRPDREERFRVATFQPVARLGNDRFYQVAWRSAAPGELDLINAHCA